MTFRIQYWSKATMNKSTKTNNNITNNIKTSTKNARINRIECEQAIESISEDLRLWEHNLSKKKTNIKTLLVEYIEQDIMNRDQFENSLVQELQE